MTDELKQIHIITKERFDLTIKKSVLKRSLNKNLSIIKSFSNGKLVLSDAENLKWLEENSAFIQNFGQNVVFDHSRISEGILDFLEKAISLESFSGNQENVQNLYEFLSENIFDREREIFGIHPALKFVLIQEIAKCVKNELKCLPELISMLHEISKVPFHNIETLYSPVERQLRYDPDGTYPRMTKGTQEHYRKKIRSLAKKSGYESEVFCKRLLDRAKKEEKHIGFYLFKSKIKWLYFPFLLLIYFTFLIYFFASIRSLVLSFFVSVPLYFFVKRVFDYIYSLCIKTNPLPAMKVDSISENEKTCVVISALIKSEEDVDTFLEKLKVYQANNQNENDKVFFGLLCDLKESSTEIEKEDEGILRFLDSKIQSLNADYPNFFAVVRKRVYHESENIFVGKERKRGAIEDFVSFLSGDASTEITLFGNREKICGTKFLITLDADTNLTFSQVRRLVGVALHPLNRPTIKKRGDRNFVVSGYGILQPKIASSLLEKISTPYGKILSNGSGIPVYAAASFDTMQNTLGEGNFCGKGLIDVDCYHKLLSNRFPAQKMLSHDMPEGAVLRCGIVSNEYFTDSNPQTLTSFYKRQHRWIRGDVQNLPFYGELTAWRKWFAVENLLSYAVPLCEFILLFVSCFYGPSIATVCALLCVLFCFEPLAITGINLILSGNVEHLYRRFATKMRNLLLNSFYQCTLSLSSIAFETYYFTDAVIRSLYRMIISKKKLLEWQVYSPFNNKKFDVFFYSFSVLGALLASFVVNNPVFLLIISLWFIFPLIACGVSKPYKKKFGWNKREKDDFLKMAKEEFSFFERFVGKSTNYLPPDNIQLEPREKIAMRTSPTNIGLYLATLVAAGELNLITTTALCNKIADAILSLKQMERWNGHLYNWYDLNTLRVIGDPFVSTVDSGNYIASLIFVVSNLKKKKSESEKVREIVEYFENEIKETNFQILIDPTHYLLKVGVHTDDPYAQGPRYDHYMSEARITSFVAVATGKATPQLWYNLNRPLLSYRGRAGIGSWSGTTFEYFMAPLFLPVIENSMEDESLSFALFCQERFSANLSSGSSVFGISESGYSLTDSNDNYQYKAFGVPYLTVQLYANYPKVISPYASFLMLERRSRSVVKNLKMFRKYGLVGECGCYEACEFHSNFLGDYSVIYSYMAHHKGMSFLALANAIKDNFIQRDFISYENFKSKTELLAERFPIDGKISKRSSFRIENNDLYFTPIPKDIKITETKQYANLMSDGKLTIIVFSDGSNRFLYRNSDLFDYKKGGLRFFVHLGDFVLDCSSKKVEKYVRFEAMATEFHFVYDKIFVLIRIEILGGQNSFLIRSEIQGFRGKCSVELDFTSVMQEESVYRSHPAFHALSLEGSLENNNFTICKRENDAHRYIHFLSSEKIQTILYGGATEQSYVKRPLITGDVRLIQEFDHGVGTKGFFIVNLGDQTPQLDYKKYLDGGYFPLRKIAEKGYLQSIRLFRECFYNQECVSLEGKILKAYHEPQKHVLKDKLISTNRDYLWKFGISGDNPILSYQVDETCDGSYEEVSRHIRVFKKMRLCGIKYDLVILQNSKRGYFNQTRDKFTEMISAFKCEFLIGSRCGIHFVSVDDKIQSEFILGLSFFSNAVNSLPMFDLKPYVPLFLHEGKSEQVLEIYDREILIDKKNFLPPVPFSHVISNRVCGFVCDQNSLGFFWYRNAGLMRISKWENIPNDGSGEKIYLQFGDKNFDLIAGAHEIKYRPHFVIYEGKVVDKEYKIIATVSELTCGKMVFVSLSEELTKGDLFYSFIPVVGREQKTKLQFSYTDNTVAFSQMMSGEIKSCGYFGVRGERPDLIQFQDRICFKSKAKSENLIFLGGFTGEKHFQFIRNMIENEPVENLLEREKSTFASLVLKDQETKSFWIHYQSLHSRYFGRTGLYQSSGAWGFRDQLQDSLIFLKTDPNFMKIHLLRCAAHQFEEGDVQHWWHTIRNDSSFDPGIRSRCSDDYLWLLFASAIYLKETGDLKILDLSVPFLKGEKLQNEDEKYISPQKGENKTFRIHLERAASLLIERPLGFHGLPLAGSGDWNDGMNQINGESVWLGFFAAISLKLSRDYLNFELQTKVDRYLESLSISLRKSYNGGWFVRAFRENGDVLGNDISVERECSIDLITQAFSAFYQLEFMGSKNEIENSKIKSALNSAYEILVDQNTRTVALFTRPFSNTEPTPGYIQRYGAGVRENGGQYTHAAVWFALALIRFGRQINDQMLIENGLKVAELLDPFVNIDRKHFDRYKREPYVLCGDVYTARGNAGHGGWSWYTGAAGWYLRLLDEIDKLKKEKDNECV